MTLFKKLTKNLINQYHQTLQVNSLIIHDLSQAGFFVEFSKGLAFGRYFQQVTLHQKSKAVPLGYTHQVSLQSAKKQGLELTQQTLLWSFLQDERPVAQTITFNDFYEQIYRPFAQKNRRPKTVYAHHSLMKTHVLNRFGQLLLSEVSRRHMMQMLAHLQESNKSAATINKVISSVQVVLRHAIDTEYLHTSEALLVKLIKDHAKRERYLSIDETKRVLAVLRNWPIRPVALLIQLLIFTGARSGEAMKANWQDIDFDQATWYVPVENDKAKKGRSIPLNEAALSVLREAWDLRVPGQQELFRSIQCKSRYKSVYLTWCKMREKASVNDVRVHDLRHSFASHLIQKKVPIAEISALLGHSSIKTTMRYAHLDQETIRQSACVMDDLFD